MIHGLPAIGVRFDINKIESGSYGVECWKIFWAAISPEQLLEALLFEGDTAASTNDKENVFCIAVQGIDAHIISKIKSALVESEAYRKVCARPNFVEGEQCTYEPLPAAGRIDYGGKLVGDAWNSREALNSLGRLKN
jgi:hypothetical protein